MSDREDWGPGSMNQPNASRLAVTHPRIALDRSGPDTTPLSIDELRTVAFVIRCARVIDLLQRVVPGAYLPPREDRIPPDLLRRLIRELKTLLPRWTWTPASRSLPRSPGKLGEALFYALTALHTRRLDLWRAGLAGPVAAIDEAYSLLYEIGARAQDRKARSKANRIANVAS